MECINRSTAARTGRTWGWQRHGTSGKILIHPADPNTVYLAAAGHLWGPNKERGVFKTTDGGREWKQVLFKDENTGAIDLAMDPRDPNIIYAAMYQRQRKGWGFNGGGPGSGIYRTTDGGATWTELTHGLPAGDKGRIGVAVAPGDDHMVYAIVEADATAGEGAGRGGRGGRGTALNLGGVFRSTDRGETWEHMSGLNPRPSYYSRIYVDPRNSSRVYIMGSNRGFFISDDGGRNFREVFSGVHGEDHVLWIDPEEPNHLIIGGDGGVSISYDRGMTWLFRLNLPIGQFYNISANNQDPFLVCGGLQDNGSWCTPSASRSAYGISFKDAFNIGGGDGMHAVFDGDDRTVLVSSQNGFTGRARPGQHGTADHRPRACPRSAPSPAIPVTAGIGPSPHYGLLPSIPKRSTPRPTCCSGQTIAAYRGGPSVPISPLNIDREKLSMMGGPVPPRRLLAPRWTVELQRPDSHRRIAARSQSSIHRRGRWQHPRDPRRRRALDRPLQWRRAAFRR